MKIAYKIATTIIIITIVSIVGLGFDIAQVECDEGIVKEKIQYRIMVEDGIQKTQTDYIIRCEGGEQRITSDTRLRLESKVRKQWVELSP